MGAIEFIWTRATTVRRRPRRCEGLIESVTFEYASRRDSHTRCHARSLQSSSIGNITVNREALEPVDLIVGVKFISRWPLETAVGGFLLETVMREPVWRMNCQFSRDESQISGAAR